MKYISVLGSTGSIGTQTLDIVRQHQEELQVISLVAGSNIKLLEEQIREFHPKMVTVYNEDKAMILKDMIKDLDVIVASGMDGVIACATEPSVDIVVTAMVGMIGILPTIEAIKAGKDIALANKETLVTAGHIIMPLIREKNVRLLPVDSEHSAIFQALNGEKQSSIHKLLLTASGGPFRGKTLENLKHVQLEDALKHPNWAMGAKITIDSATMVNKGLEVMEAKWLFDIPVDQIQVLVHPQSIIHSMIEYVDGSIIAQMGLPDMRLPIQYALFYPDRVPMINQKKTDFFQLKQLTFEEPDLDTFYGLGLALEAGRKGGSLPTVYNAANEWAVARFLEKKIQFLDIPSLIQAAMQNHQWIEEPSLNDILNTERMTYDFMKEITQLC